jgi:hypothetical protein
VEKKMSEKLQQESNKENEKTSAELEKTSIEQHDRLNENREKNAEKSKENDVDTARHELEKIDAENEKEKRQSSPAERRKDHPLKRDKKSLNASFKKTMLETRSEMSAPSKLFSAIIHNKMVEKTSDAVGSTIARSNALLSGSFFALIFTAGLYLWARYVGYPLSGFETIGAFIIGYLVGIIFDFTRIMVTGKR